MQMDWFKTQDKMARTRFQDKPKPYPEGSITLDTNRRGKPGRPKTIWPRTVEAELVGMGIAWDEAQKMVKDNDRWRGLAAALCSTWGQRA